MLYFKNSELTATYRVALNTVLNWVKAAQAGKLDLELVGDNGRMYIANTARNIDALQELALERKKYRNTRTTRVVSPSLDFYRIYDTEEVQDIISNLDFRREIPRAYNYFSVGAHYWDEYVNSLAVNNAPNTTNRTQELLQANLGYIDGLLQNYKKVNIVDIGPGNAITSRGIIQHLLDRGVMGRYIGLDISTEMLKIAKENILDWFGESVSFEGHKLDITHQRFGKIVADEYLRPDADSTVNLVLCLGDLLGNLRNPEEAWAVIASSLGKRDVLIMSGKLDTSRTRHRFDFSTSPNNTLLPPIHRFMFDLLNIDASLYEVEMGFHPEKHARFTRVHMKVALNIQFEVSGGTRAVQIEKGDSILVWYFWQKTLEEASTQLMQNGFYPLLLSQSTDREFLLSISQLEQTSSL